MIVMAHPEFDKATKLPVVLKPYVILGFLKHIRAVLELPRMPATSDRAPVSQAFRIPQLAADLLAGCGLEAHA